MDQIQAPLTGKFLHQTFLDSDEMTAVLDLNLRITPLTLEGFACDLMRIDLGDISFNFMVNAVPIRVLGPKPNQEIPFAFLIDPADDQKLLSHYSPMNVHTIFGFDCYREANLVIQKSVKYCFVFVGVHTFNRYLSMMQRDDLDGEVLSHNYANIAQTIQPLQTFLMELFTLARNQASCLTNPSFQRLLREDFITLLIQAIPIGGKRHEPPSPQFHRADLMRQAEVLLEAHIDQPLSVAALAQGIFTSKRTLMYAFDQILGISPMAYLKVLRLQAVRQQLKMAHPEAQTVSAIATDYGFYSHGHFARDYKRLFGESPVHTLKKTS